MILNYILQKLKWYFYGHVPAIQSVILILLLFLYFYLYLFSYCWKFSLA